MRSVTTFFIYHYGQFREYLEVAFFVLFCITMACFLGPSCLLFFTLTTFVSRFLHCLICAILLLFFNNFFMFASKASDLSFLPPKELKRLVAYARSSANLLTRLVLHDRNDTHGWEVGNDI